MAYDKADWHLEGEFPKELDHQAAFTHTGMYLAWAILMGLASEEVEDDFGEDVEGLRARSVGPVQLYQTMDGSFTEEELSDDGNAFTESYFDQYLKDYQATLCNGLPSLYHAAATWENFDKLKTVLDARLAAWRAEQ